MWKVACSLDCYCFAEQKSQSFTVELISFASFGFYLLILLAGCGVLEHVQVLHCCINLTQRQMAAVLSGLQYPHPQL